jgi:hypothetical protein
MLKYKGPYEPYPYFKSPAAYQVGSVMKGLSGRGGARLTQHFLQGFYTVSGIITEAGSHDWFFLFDKTNGGNFGFIPGVHLQRL